MCVPALCGLLRQFRHPQPEFLVCAPPALSARLGWRAGCLGRHEEGWGRGGAIGLVQVTGAGGRGAWSAWRKRAWNASLLLGPPPLTDARQFTTRTQRSASANAAHCIRQRSALHPPSRRTAFWGTARKGGAWVASGPCLECGFSRASGTRGDGERGVWQGGLLVHHPYWTALVRWGGGWLPVCGQASWMGWAPGVLVRDRGLARGSRQGCVKPDALQYLLRHVCKQKFSSVSCRLFPALHTYGRLKSSSLPPWIWTQVNLCGGRGCPFREKKGASAGLCIQDAA